MGSLAQYVQHCKVRAAADEGTVWRAVDCFGVNWDIEDSDFPAMFADAMQQAQLALDNPALQPIGGVQTLMLRGRQRSSWCGSASAGCSMRTAAISPSAGAAPSCSPTRSTGWFRRVFPRMCKYTMNTANAVFFLNLWEPHDELLLSGRPRRGRGRITLATRPTFGGGTALDLPRYYTMCNDLLARAGELPGDHRPAQGLRGAGTGRHRRRSCTCLVYDILHTAYAEQFYPKRLHPRLDEQGSVQRL